MKKPGPKAEQDELEEYQRQKKEKNLSVQFVSTIQELRDRLHQTGHAAKPMSVVADGSFCNR